MDTTYGHDPLDHDLLKAVAAGDLASFERLYELYATRVLHYVRTFVHEPAVAEEILGDVMFAIWRGAGTFTGTARVSTWILGIARRVFGLNVLGSQCAERWHHHRGCHILNHLGDTGGKLMVDQGAIGDGLSVLTTLHSIAASVFAVLHPDTNPNRAGVSFASLESAC